MKRILAAFMAVFLCLIVINAHSATLAPQGPFRAFDDDGEPCAGCKLYTYEAGTTTPKDSYTTQAGDTANANPVILDSAGYADVWLGEGGYKFTLKDASDVTLWTLDSISSGTSGVLGDNVTEVSSGTTVTSDYAGDLFVTTDTLTLSLSPAATVGEGFTFAVRNESGTTTIDPDSSESIDDALTKTVYEGGSLIATSTGSEWKTFAYTYGETIPDNKIFSGSIQFSSAIRYSSGGSLDISSGSIAPLAVQHAVDTESDAAIDVLATASGGSDGEIIMLRASDGDRAVIIDESGNFLTGDMGYLMFDDTEKSATFIYDSTLSKWRIIGTGGFNPLPNGYIRGMVVNNNSVDADHDLDITSGEARSASELYDIRLSSGMTKQADVAWAAGTNAGGLSSSLTALANDTWYYVHAVLINGAADVCIDTSATAANCITDHGATAYRIIGHALTDGSADFIAFESYETTGGAVQTYWTDPPESFTGTVTTSTSTATLTIPPSTNTTPTIINVYQTGSTTIGYVFPTFVTAETPTASGAPGANVGGVEGANQLTILADTSKQINVRTSQGGGETVKIITIGWITPRL